MDKNASGVAGETSAEAAAKAEASGNHDGDALVAALCNEESRVANSVVASLSVAVTDDIPAPDFDAGEKSLKRENDKDKEVMYYAKDTPKGGEVPTEKARVEVREVAFVDDNDDDADQSSSDMPAVASWSPYDHDSGDQDDADVPITADGPIVDAIAVEAIPTKDIPSDKTFPAPAIFENVVDDNFTTLCGAPRFDIEALTKDGFVYQYASEGWMSDDIPLE